MKERTISLTLSPQEFGELESALFKHVEASGDFNLVRNLYEKVWIAWGAIDENQRKVFYEHLPLLWGDVGS